MSSLSTTTPSEMSAGGEARGIQNPAKADKELVPEQFLSPKKVCVTFHALTKSCQSHSCFAGERGVTSGISKEVWICEEADPSEDVFCKSLGNL